MILLKISLERIKTKLSHVTNVDKRTTVSEDMSLSRFSISKSVRYDKS